MMESERETITILGAEPHTQGEASQLCHLLTADDGPHEFSLGNQIHPGTHCPAHSVFLSIQALQYPFQQGTAAQLSHGQHQSLTANTLSGASGANMFISLIPAGKSSHMVI